MRVQFQQLHKYLVYKYTCIISNKSYIGQTRDLTKRAAAHRKSGSGCVAFRNAIQKYGWNNFKLEVLADCLTVEQANELEQKYIIEHCTMAPTGYNLTSGGLNRIVSEETRQKISSSNKGKLRPKTKEHRNKIAQTLSGRKIPIEIVEKRSLLLKGRKKTAEHINKIIVSNTGKKRTEETKLRMSQSHLNRKLSEETKQKISKANTGKRWQQTQCPVCGKSGRSNAMFRWHFNNCRSITSCV